MSKSYQRDTPIRAAMAMTIGIAGHLLDETLRMPSKKRKPKNYLQKITNEMLDRSIDQAGNK